MNFDYDLIVIGGGSGGVRCARMSARMGARVLCIEDRFWGGTCVNVGCVPKKLFTFAAQGADDVAVARSFGWNIASQGHDWAHLQNVVTNETARLQSVYRRLLINAGVDVMEGRARLVSPHEVEIDRDARAYPSSLQTDLHDGGIRSRANTGNILRSAKYIVIATGSVSRVPEFSGGTQVQSSDDFFAWNSLPQDLVILGGGYIACELASIVARLQRGGDGARVTMVHRGERVLRGFDHEAVLHLQHCLEQDGITLLTNTCVESIRDEGASLLLTLQRDGESFGIRAERILQALGRLPATHAMGLTENGVQLGSDGRVLVDAQLRSSVPSIFAVGDVTGGDMLTPVALSQGMQVANHLFGGDVTCADTSLVPVTVFTHPAMGAVGLSEDAARAAGYRLRIYRTTFRPMSHQFMEQFHPVFVKLVVDTLTDKVLGVHVVSGHAEEIIQGFAVALGMGVTKRQLDMTLGIHPSIAEELVTLREPVSEDS